MLFTTLVCPPHAACFMLLPPYPLSSVSHTPPEVSRRLGGSRRSIPGCSVMFWINPPAASTILKCIMLNSLARRLSRLG